MINMHQNWAMASKTKKNTETSSLNVAQRGLGVFRSDATGCDCR